MKLRVSRIELRFWLLASLGVVPLACGGETQTSGGGAGATGPDCANPTPLVASSGYVKCAGGRKHRESVLACPSSLPRAGYTCENVIDGGPQTCATDGDCTAQPNGYCQLFPGQPTCGCNYGCTTDADCGAGKICQCGDPVGTCVSATCTSDADCGAGQLCADYDASQGCQTTTYACTTPADACFEDADCGAGMLCIVAASGHRACAQTMCAIGRPFLVEGTARVASLAPRSDWNDALAPALPDDPARRQELAAWWRRSGQLEHASVAAFARFTLELLALGAPPELVLASQQAGLDETRHARLCFAMASAYAGEPVGPGPLDVQHALGPADPVALARVVFHEGCIGETAAALDAAEAAAAATDPVVADALARLAADEGEHALLAWKSVRWLLTQDARVLPALHEELARADDSPVLRDVVTPALAALADHRRA